MGGLIQNSPDVAPLQENNCGKVFLANMKHREMKLDQVKLLKAN